MSRYRYLIIYVSHGTRRVNLISYRDLTADHPRTVQLVTEWEGQFNMIGNDGPTFYFFTDQGAPRARVVAININHQVNRVDATNQPLIERTSVLTAPHG